MTRNGTLLGTTGLHVFTGICRILGYARFSPNFFPPPFDRKIEKISYKM